MSELHDILDRIKQMAEEAGTFTDPDGDEIPALTCVVLTLDQRNGEKSMIVTGADFLVKTLLAEVFCEMAPEDTTEVVMRVANLMVQREADKKRSAEAN